ncbi:glycoside hydrolase family 81 protein [Auricularia subglabra TFB-10046 SS5]|nr:glycoside hydrolase family 81 protein [Auricularia subglabra TFB-10046 SS5]
MVARLRPSLVGVLSCALAANAALGPIGTSRPVLAGGTIANAAPPGSFFQDFKPPFPTDTWWVGYGAPPTQDAAVAGPFPYQSSLSNTAIQVHHTSDFDGVSIHQPTQLDWGASFVEHTGGAADHKALRWDEHSVTVQYFQRNGTGTLTSALVPGSPYITLQYAGATPLLISRGGNITSINGATVSGTTATVSGTKFTIVSPIGTYLIYSLNGAVTLSASSTALRAGAKFTGVLRMAKLADPAHQATLDTYVANYPTAVTTDYTFSGDSATLSFTWTVTGTAANLLMLTWPHHRLRLQNPNFLATSAIGYLTTKGWMYGNVGNVWRLPYTLSTIEFNAPRAVHSSCTSQLTRTLEFEVANLGDPPVPNEFYNWGGKVAAVSRLALIADQLGRTDLRNTVVAWLKASYNFWTDTTSTTATAAYETGWGGVIDKLAAADPGPDFGNGFYNDHHFHYGYFLAASAVIAKFDPSWLTQTPARGTSSNGDMLQWFARDIVNPSPQDPYFTVVRHMDWFAGHSWASGIAGGAGSRDQESTSEAINGYYGALLYAVATNNTNLRNFARLLVAIEQEGSRVYWHLDPTTSPTARDNPYPEAGLRNLITIGNVQDWQAGAWLFWGDQRVEIAAIQILPVTPINEALYVAPWVNNVVNYAAGELADGMIDDAWKSVIYLAYSNANPQDAATRSAQLMSWGSGNSASNQLYFLSTRPNPSGQAICNAAQDSPAGTFVLQDVATGRYVVSTAASPNLIASATSASAGTPFKLAWRPGSSTSTIGNQFVSGEIDGVAPLIANRPTASTWETFLIRPAAAAGTYTFQALSNNAYVASTTTGLINSATAISGAATFRLVA